MKKFNNHYKNIYEAIKLSKTEYITFIDSNITLTDTILNNAIKLCKKENSDILEWFLLRGNYNPKLYNGAKSKSDRYATIKNQQLKNWMYYDPKENRLFDKKLTGKLYKKELLLNAYGLLDKEIFVDDFSLDYDFLSIFLVSRLAKIYTFSERYGGVDYINVEYARSENYLKINKQIIYKDMIFFIKYLPKFIKEDLQGMEIFFGQYGFLVKNYENMTCYNKKLMRSLYRKLKESKYLNEDFKMMIEFISKNNGKFYMTLKK